MSLAPLTAGEPLAGLIETSRTGTGAGLTGAGRAVAAVRAARPPAAAAPPCAAPTIPAVPTTTTMTAPDTQAAVFREMLRTVIPPIRGVPLKRSAGRKHRACPAGLFPLRLLSVT